MDLKCIFRASPKAWEIGTTTTQLPQPLVPVTQAEAGLVIGLTEELVFIWAGKLGQSVINLFNPSSQTWSVIITGCPHKFGFWYQKIWFCRWCDDGRRSRYTFCGLTAWIYPHCYRRQWARISRFISSKKDIFWLFLGFYFSLPLQKTNCNAPLPAFCTVDFVKW